MTDDKDRIKLTMRKLITWLVEKDYEAIEQFSGGVRLTSKLIRNAIDEYGGEVIFPDPEAFENIDSILVDGSSPNRWSIVFALWTKEEGRSDLSLECTFISNGNILMGIEVDNLHVL